MQGYTKVNSSESILGYKRELINFEMNHVVKYGIDNKKDYRKSDGSFKKFYKTFYAYIINDKESTPVRVAIYESDFDKLKAELKNVDIRKQYLIEWKETTRGLREHKAIDYEYDVIR